MNTERFELQHVAMAAASSKILQIARKVDRTGYQKNTTGKHIPHTIPDP
jgi:hypothetical protein